MARRDLIDYELERAGIEVSEAYKKAGQIEEETAQRIADMKATVKAVSAMVKTGGQMAQADAVNQETQNYMEKQDSSYDSETNTYRGSVEMQDAEGESYQQSYQLDQAQADAIKDFSYMHGTSFSETISMANPEGGTMIKPIFGYGEGPDAIKIQAEVEQYLVENTDFEISPSYNKIQQKVINQASKSDNAFDLWDKEIGSYISEDQEGVNVQISEPTPISDSILAINTSAEDLDMKGINNRAMQSLLGSESTSDKIINYTNTTNLKELYSSNPSIQRSFAAADTYGSNFEYKMKNGTETQLNVKQYQYLEKIKALGDPDALEKAEDFILWTTGASKMYARRR